METGYLPRLLDAVLERRIQHHAAILIVGPRAAGKTTTAQRLARTTIRLDRAAEAAVVRADADAALRDLEEPVLIDEWQVVPEVLGAIKRAVDREPRPGRFLITGSVRGEVDEPTWPGTGRLLRVSMYGLAESEILGRIPAVPLLDRLSQGDLDRLSVTPADPLDLRDYAELAVRGGYPEPVLRLPHSERDAWLDSYIHQLLTRDLAELSPRRDPHRLRSYLEAYAIHSASVVDQSTLRQAAGVAKATGEAYEELLRNLFVVDLVPAWWSNRLKRLVRAPKRYFTDSALALAALRVDLQGLLKDGHLLGRMLDTLVLAQLRAELARCDSRPRLFHLRQQQGRREVDAIVEYGGGRVFALEIKARASPGLEDARHLLWLRDQLGKRFLGGAVLHTGPRAFDLHDRIIAAPISVLWS
jgi:predicted AAA+ superfamily ATPase